MTLAAPGPCLNTCKVLTLHLRTGKLSMTDRSSVVIGVSLAGLTRPRFVLITDIAIDSVYNRIKIKNGLVRESVWYGITYMMDYL